MRALLSSAVLLLAVASSADSARATSVERSFRPSSLVFFPNLRAEDPDLAFSVLGSDTTVELRGRSVRILMSDPARVPADLHSLGLDTSLLPPAGTPDDAWVDPRIASMKALDLELAGARADLAPVASEEAATIVSQFRGTPEQWVTGRHAAFAVRYEDAWPGIDLTWRGAAGGLKYQFDVAPGADPSLIAWIVRGASSVAVAKDGSLVMTTPGGTLTDGAPVAWEGADAQPVASRWTAEEIGAGAWRVGFAVDGRDASLPLVIDPAVFVYGTFLGSSIDDRGLGVAVDPAGNAYLCGEAPNGTSYDAYVAKYDAAGTTLVYLGLIGGSSYDAAFDVAVDAAGQAYVVGSATSSPPSFPAFLGPDVTYGGAQADAFIAKLNAAGTSLLYCGYIGGAGFDFAEGVRVDAAGAAYVSGVVGSDQATFPVKVGPDLTYNGRYDTFACKIVPSPTSPVVANNFAWCGYIGGRSQDVGVTGGFYTNGHIGIDAAGNAYVSGMTKSDEKSFPDGDGFGALPGWDKTHAGGGYDGYVVKILASGTGLAWGGYIGGRKSDECFGMGIDAAGNAYVTGDTNSTESTFPVIMGPDLTANGDRDAFVAKINPSGTALVYCGFIGGADLEQGLGLAVDAAGSAHVIGHTHSSQATFPAVSGPDLTFNGTGRDVGDAFIAKVLPTPSSPVPSANFAYCGYVGGSGEDSSYWVALDASGNAYVAGDTDSTGATFPDGDGFGAVPGQNQVANGEFDAFLVKVAP